MIFDLLFNKKKNYYEDVKERFYTDLHTHILPSVDDGSIDMDMSLEMIYTEVKQGARYLILTPHFRFEENDIDIIRDEFSKLQQIVKDADLPIELYLGGEIYYDTSTIEKLVSGQILTMADTRYVLVEFSPTVAFQYLTHAMDELLMAGYYPILAHVERYQFIAEDFSKVEELIDKGVYIQVNANSFLNHPKKKTLIRLLKDGDIHFVGTDCHRTDWRPVNLQETCRYLADYIDREDYCRVFFENPQKLLNNEII